MAACIGTSEPWALTSVHGAVRLAPLRLMSPDQRHKVVPSEHVTLRLTDLGHSEGSYRDVLAGTSSSPLAVRSEVVLLLPWSLLPVISKLEADARAVPYEHDPTFAPEDWLAAWHHFVDVDAQPPSQVLEAVAREARALRLTPSTGRRHHVFGSRELPSAPSTSVSAGGRAIRRGIGFGDQRLPLGADVGPRDVLISPSAAPETR